MATIGTFKSAGDGFTGSIKTLSCTAKASIRTSEKTRENAPDFRIYAGAVELGAAWSRSARDGSAYLSVKLDDPSFAAPIFATLPLDPEREAHPLIWTRRAA